MEGIRLTQNSLEGIRQNFIELKAGSKHNEFQIRKCVAVSTRPAMSSGAGDEDAPVSGQETGPDTPRNGIWVLSFLRLLK